jgi:hypothetical protein
LRISTDAAFSIRPSSKSSIHTFIHNSSMITATALSTTSLHSAAGYMAPFHNAFNAETVEVTCGVDRVLHGQSTFRFRD